MFQPALQARGAGSVHSHQLLGDTGGPGGPAAGCCGSPGAARPGGPEGTGDRGGLVRGVGEPGALQGFWAGSMRAPLRVPTALSRAKEVPTTACSCRSPIAPAASTAWTRSSLHPVGDGGTQEGPWASPFPLHQHLGGWMTEGLLPAHLLSDTSLGAAVTGKPDQEPE